MGRAIAADDFSALGSLPAARTGLFYCSHGGFSVYVLDFELIEDQDGRQRQIQVGTPRSSVSHFSALCCSFDILAFNGLHLGVR